jgi:hypothetical protein
MSRSRMLTALVAVLATAFAASTASASASEVVYSNVPLTLPGNFASYGAEAYSFREIGGQLELAGSARNHPQVEVVMSTWACQFGAWFNGTCETPKPTKKFKWPLTLRMYEVGEKGVVGEKIGEVTKTFGMPYRPSEDHVNCETGRWYDAESKTCFHGKAFIVKFPALKTLRMPKRVIVGISYDTSHYGPKEVGNTECNTKSAGCYYDSLNVGVKEAEEGLPSFGSDPSEPYISLADNGAVGSEGCGNNAVVEKFELDECFAFWEGTQPLLRVNAR